MTASRKITNHPLQSILLLTPYRQNDPRWQTILFTPAALLLASALDKAGFRVERRQVALPFNGDGSQFCGFDAIGLSLYEDLIADYPALLTLLRRHHPGYLIAGGPLLTRLPELTMDLLPELDIGLRGEAETALPKVLSWLGTSAPAPEQLDGLFWRTAKGLMTHHADRVNRPVDLDGLVLNFELLKDNELTEGLEINISRGCRRSCLFCCHIQGRHVRHLSPAVLTRHLANARRRIERLSPIPGRALSLNINDDDLLQDRDYAAQILAVIRHSGFKIWGLQTAIASFFDQHGQINQALLDLVAEPALYHDKPLLWLGTDAFLPQRSHRLGKHMPSLELFSELLRHFEGRAIRHYHYWICSDHDSDWPEFIAELHFILELRQRFSGFSLLAHAPFLVPYVDTPLWQLLKNDQQRFGRIRFAKPLKHGKMTWNQPLRIEPHDTELTRLLDNQPDSSGICFFEALKENDTLAINTRLYNGLRQARLLAHEPERITLLKDQENALEGILAGLV